MAIGDVTAVPGTDDVYYVDTGMYETEMYGSVYIIDAERPAFVDTGIGTNHEHLLDALDELDIAREDVEYLLPTHIHLDHAGGAGYLADACPNATVMTHEIGVSHLIDPEKLIAGTKAAVGDQWEFYVEPKPVPEDRIEPLTDGNEIDLGDRTLSVFHAPGHAPHQTMFLDSKDDLLFTGDAAGIYVPERGQVRQTSPPSQFDLEACLDDVRTIEEIAPERICFGHFGSCEYSEELMESYKRTLVEWVEAVRQKREELGDDDAVIEHFAEHTQMTDLWGERKASEEEKLNVRGVLGYLDWQAEQE
ncbi:zn-dependent hydrolase, glyoxylase [Halogeometricum borinquense DSM 11551]|uniref:Zn-dependent hydrolase, glyoxylase n=2 Tax=Halogeometricum borinquense TaxID=60847 RepID=E4NM19_HALBP|nr:MBL fold metallo-hydrolase [Halogeometricum borinquense]ADQ66118.1 Zn-dependent hydrolase, glyoxylase [Halogeometricum borinquense DSM 11551]ELY27387.1 zn-dependent hydrolase, glyoxylase [Halogeometricum borinquense DSM 11551]RYJ14839.1 MBL fold metallo-hydrolase [Halogeometricum borinquense]